MSGVTTQVAARGPIYRLEVAGKDQVNATIKGVKKLPTGGDQPWSISMWVKTDHQPQDRTVIAGFAAARTP